ncbi:MAG: hypothetical protein HYW77_01550 [Parcubacteria group bacterium]|nr:hypothetical protein [Parcubacteria group bacterium]
MEHIRGHSSRDIRDEMNDEVDSLRAKIQSLEAENAELKKDKERLDFIDKYKLPIERISLGVRSSFWRIYFIDSFIYEFNLRECIDSQIRKEVSIIKPVEGK